MTLRLRFFAALVAALLSGSAAAVDRIEFRTVSLKPKFIPYLDALVGKYEAQHPGVKLEWIDYPWDVLQTRLIARIVAGKPPALVDLNVPRADEYAADGLIVPIDALMAGARSTYLNAAIVAWNRMLFKAGGLTRAPRSLGEQLEFARLLTLRTGTPGFKPLLGSVDGFFLRQGLPVLRNNKANFATPQHVALIQKLALTYRAVGLLKDRLFAENNFAAVISAYNAGRLAMLVGPATAMRRILTDAAEIYAVTEVAAAPLGPSGIADGGWRLHFSVPKGVDASLMPALGDFPRYLTNDDNQLAFAVTANVFPTAIKAGQTPYFATLPAHPTPSQQAVVAATRSMPYSRTLYVAGVTDYDELRRILVIAVEAGVTGRKDIALALSEATAAWDRKLAEPRRN